MPATPKRQMRTRTQDIARKMRQQNRLRRKCVEAVWLRAGARCEECQRRVYVPAVAPSYDLVGHVHEVRPRSLGGDSTDPAQCVLLCHTHHFCGPSGAHRVTPNWRQE